MGSTGESVRRLSDFGFAPSWSPDGRELVVSTVSFDDPMNRTGRGELWAIDTVSGAKRELALGVDAVQPSWSPHGYRVAYWGIQGSAAVSVTSGRLPRMGQSRARAGWESPTIALDWSPNWSPDGRYLFFSSDRGGTMNIWRVPVDEQSGRVLGEPEAVTTPSSWAAG